MAKKNRNRQQEGSNMESQDLNQQDSTDQQEMNQAEQDTSDEGVKQDAPAVENLGVTQSPDDIIKNLLNGQNVVQSIPQPVVQEVVPAVVTETVPTVDTTDFDKLLAELKLKGTSEEKSLIHTLETYVEKMAPGRPMNSTEGAQHQYTLWMALFNVIHNAPSSQFKSLWNIVLAFFKKHEKGALGECYYNRFSEMWKYDLRQLAAYQRLVNLISLTADPETRAVGLRQVNLDVTLSEGFSEDGRNRLIMFYKR